MIKQRIKTKLKVSEREFKQWRLGRVSAADSSQMFDTHMSRNLLRDEDTNADLVQFFFGDADGGGKHKRICLEHTHPPSDRGGSRTGKSKAALTIR